jgi:retron-type reverse transcriptase
LATDPRQLERYGLPCWRDERELAAALDLSVGKLRSLATHRVAERRPQYVTFEIPKRSGGTRRIHAPKRTLMQVQRKLLALLIQRLPMHEAAHGFRKGRSIKTGAQMHVGKRVILKLDVHEFFPSITFARIRGYLVAMGYGYEVACSMAVLCTEAQRQPVQVAGELVHVPVGQRHAPQGAPTSPGLSNAICMRLDRRLWGVARKHGFLYSRYADDMTFSGDDVSVVAKLCASAIAILRSEGFEPNRHKTRVLRRGRSQRVTGVTVNEKLGLSRKERRRIRAAIHQAGGSAQADARLRGKLSYVRMLNPEQAEALERQHAARQGVDAMKR